MIDDTNMNNFSKNTKSLSLEIDKLWGFVRTLTWSAPVSRGDWSHLIPLFDFGYISAKKNQIWCGFRTGSQCNTLCNFMNTPKAPKLWISAQNFIFAERLKKMHLKKVGETWSPYDDMHRCKGEWTQELFSRLFFNV